MQRQRAVTSSGGGLSSAMTAVCDSTGKPVVCNEGWPSEAQADHIAPLDRVRIWRETDTARQMLSIHILEPDQSCPRCSGGSTLAVCPVVRRFALRYPGQTGRAWTVRPQQEVAAVPARIRLLGPYLE
ncbi:hypothetical protein GCM10022207_79570 [Streptomyces lannensis]|uniref:Uncharacterized protein n=1 Tax=Streptomyces lannensis TaxID=766498 RepID=A0ABP7LEL3_9ACTN